MSDLDKTMIMHSLKGKIGVLRRILSDPKIRLTKSDRYKKELLLWRYVGFTEHKINYTKLTQVSKKHEHLGLVPKGYMYAELFAHTRETLRFQDLNQRILEHKQKQSGRRENRSAGCRMRATDNVGR